MTGSGNSNQRVTNAVLAVKLDHVIEGRAAIKENQKEQGHRIQANAKACTEHNVLWKEHAKVHADLNVKKWAGDIGAAVAGAIAGASAAIFKS